MYVPPEIVRARETGQPVRVHTTDGEVLVARVLGYDEMELVYTVLSSSRPERYAVCDSTGFVIPISEIERARLLEEPRRSRRRGDLEREG
jgi:hypothetical protein